MASSSIKKTEVERGFNFNRGRKWPQGRHYKNFFLAPIRKQEFQSKQFNKESTRIRNNKPHTLQPKRCEPWFQAIYEDIWKNEREFHGNEIEKRTRVSGQNERIFGQEKGIDGIEGERKRNSGLEKKTQRRGKRFRSSMHPGVAGKEEVNRQMGKSNHIVSLGCDVETLEEYTAKWRRRAGEN